MDVILALNKKTPVYYVVIMSNSLCKCLSIFSAEDYQCCKDQPSSVVDESKGNTPRPYAAKGLGVFLTSNLNFSLSTFFYKLYSVHKNNRRTLLW